MHGGERRGLSRCFSPAGKFWIAGGCRIEIDAARGREAERSKGIYADREVHAAPGHSLKSEWDRGIWVRCSSAGDVDSGGGAAAGLRRESGENRRERSNEDSRSEGGGADTVGRRSDRRRILAGEIGSRQTSRRVGSRAERQSFHRANAARFFGDFEDARRDCKKSGRSAGCVSRRSENDHRRIRRALSRALHDGTIELRGGFARR